MADLLRREGTAARALRFLILTAARTDEVISMRWSEIDMAAKLWTAPPEHMKGGRKHRVPLNGPPLAILHEMIPGDDTKDVRKRYVFPGAKPDRPLSNMMMLELIRRMNAERSPLAPRNLSF
jgi:integrase